MPWQAAEGGTIAQDEQGAYHVKVGNDWVPAPKGSVAQDEGGKYHFNSDSLAPPPPPAAPPSATPQMDDIKARTGVGQPGPGVGAMVGNAAKDIGGTVARGVGAVADVATNAYHALNGEPTVEPNSPESRATRYAAPFQHPSDNQPANYLQDKAHEAGQAIENSGPLGQTVMHDVVPPVSDIAKGVGAVAAGKSLIGAGARAADAGINALNKPTAAQAATLASNPLVGRMRGDGFKITANDMRAVNPSAPDSDIHGPTRSAPDTTDTIQRHNAALATEKATTDVKLPNTRAVNPDEIKARLDQEGAVYDEVGQAVGHIEKPTVNLEHDLASAAPRAATPTAAAENAKLVDSYRGHLGSGFAGPDGVQMVKALREEAHTRMAGNDANDQSLGRTQLGIANAIENEMMRNLPANAQDLKARFPEARMQYAKLKELDSVTDGGQVNPSKALQLKRSGAPLSGGMSAIANAADVAPESMIRATGAPSTIAYAPTHTGLIRDAVNVGKAVVHKLPGMNPASDAYQEAHYGPTGGNAATPPSSSAPTSSAIPPPMELKAPPGSPTGINAGNQHALELPPGREPAPPFELSHPEGQAFEPGQRPLVRSNTAGNVMDRATWDREALDRVQRYKQQVLPIDESRAAQGPVKRDLGDLEDRKAPREPTGTSGSEEFGASRRERLGEALRKKGHKK